MLRKNPIVAQQGLTSIAIVAQTFRRQKVDESLVSANVAQNPIVAQQDLTRFAIVAQTFRRLKVDESLVSANVAQKSHRCAPSGPPRLDATRWRVHRYVKFASQRGV